MKVYPVSKREDNKKIDFLQDPDSKLDLNHFFRDNHLHVDGYEEDMNGCLLLYTRSSKPHGVCPYCQSVSRKVHSRYMRRLQDLPAFGKNVILCFQARKFFCHNKECRYRTFAEQPGNEVFRYRRRTRRCEVIVYRQGLQLSSINSSCMLVNMGIRISKSTILRDLHRLRTPQCTEIRKIGVDDWAFRKGIDYGTIIIDLSRGIPVDLLGTRNEEDFSKWLSDHRDVWLVSRDRSTEYSHAIAASGLKVTEVADRFHLIKNMGECISHTVSDKYDEVTRILRGSGNKGERVTDNCGRKKESYVNEVKFNEVKRLQKEGKGISETASLLGIARQTVRKYRGLESFPVPKGKPRHDYHLHRKYVEEQYARGVSLDKIRLDLWSMGFKVSKTPFHDHFRYLADGHRGYRSAKDTAAMERAFDESPKEEKTVALPPVNQLAVMINKSALGKELTDYECEVTNALFGVEWFDQLLEAAGSFLKCLRSNKPVRLERWLDKYEKSILPRIRTFVRGIRMDIKAVKNAMIYPVSNGITEGFVNKLKTIKRVMYGKAKLPLLKIKMVMTTWIFN